jgi:hypothetical protein
MFPHTENTRVIVFECPAAEVFVNTGEFAQAEAVFIVGT